MENSQQDSQIHRRIRCRRERHSTDTEVLDALQASSVSIRISGEDHTRVTAQRVGGDVRRVAHDEVAGVAEIEQGVSRGAHTNNHRLVLADEVAQVGYALTGIRGWCDDEDLLAVHGIAELRHAYAVNKQRRFRVDELDAVAKIGFHVVHECALCAIKDVVSSNAAEVVCLGNDLLAHDDLTIRVHRGLLAVTEGFARSSAGAFKEWNAGIEKQLRPIIRDVARGEFRDVHDSSRTLIRERLRLTTRQIRRIHNGDIARAELA